MERTIELYGNKVCVVVNGHKLYALVKPPVWECKGADVDGEK